MKAPTVFLLQGIDILLGKVEPRRIEIGKVVRKNLGAEIRIKLDAGVVAVLQHSRHFAPNDIEVCLGMQGEAGTAHEDACNCR